MTKSKQKTRTESLTKNPALFQVNTRVCLTELSKQLGRPATLDDIEDQFLDELKGKGFAWVYFLSVWQTGEVGRSVSRNHPGWLEGFKSDLPDLTDDDICGSGFAITEYSLNKAFGKKDALPRLRERLNSRGMKLMLDLVPNHTAVDHHWVQEHPEYYVEGDEDAIAYSPQNFIRVGNRILAHGRDPYFDGWPDTLQLNYASSDLQKAMTGELLSIASNCDGLRCDMAMLVLPDVFLRTWSLDMKPFWADAIACVRQSNPDFVFMAEVYWDREWDLQQLGFDYTYDKKLYDRLRQGSARAVREHFWADKDYQFHSARFLENHDEPRAAGTFSKEQHRAAAVISFLCPGLRFFHQGQFEGYCSKVSVHLSRRRCEEIDVDIKEFYDSLLSCLKLPVVHNGDWSLVQCDPAWDDNWTADCFIAFAWSDPETGEVLIAAVNYSQNQAQCTVHLPPDLRLDPKPRALGACLPERSSEGVNFDLPPWGYSVNVLSPQAVKAAV